MNKLLVLCVISFCLGVSSSQAQTVPFPTGNRDFNAVTPWGYTQVGTSWNTAPFLPFIYQDMWFRVVPPNGVTWNAVTKTWNVPAGQKYPTILFFHGAGEVGTDNNHQLTNGGQVHMNAVLAGQFPGFVIFPQNVAGAKAKILMEKLITFLAIDINRIYVHGLSNGGTWAWDFFVNNPTMVAGFFPMSANSNAALNTNFLFNPIRQAQGALDTNPNPGWTISTVNFFQTNGGNYEYFLLDGVGHGTWNYMYNRADFFPWFLSQKKNKISVLFNKYEICPGMPISVTMGFTPGFDAYEWRKDGVLISGATAYTITVTQFGSYTGRIKNRGVWSEWSDPVVSTVKGVTNTPPVTITGLYSNYLPSVDGRTTTRLTLPDGYETYTWKNGTTNAVVATTQNYTGASVGTYKASVKEFNGCSSNDSPIFTVYSADGANKPDVVGSFIGYATSQTQVTLNWTDNPSPIVNESAFEVYRALALTGPYTLIGINAQNVVAFNDTGLLPNTTYYYKVRPVGPTSAAAASDPFSVLTQVDALAPTTPSNLIITSTTANGVQLQWGASTDNVGVYRYDVYKNGVKTLSVSGTTATIYNLTENEIYNFTVKARDYSGNSSPESNQVTSAALASGLTYKYYEGAWTSLPNFNTLSPKKIGNTPNIDITVRDAATNFAMTWEGKIYIPVAGNYTFGTTSDNGSKVYIGSYDEANLVVNNDGNHTSASKEGTKNFPAPGAYPIFISYFQSTASLSMALYWKNTASGVVAATPIPNSAFVVPTAPFAVPRPTPPTLLTATAISYSGINLTWQDNSADETGFQIYRSTVNAGPYVAIATLPANTTSYSDTKLTATTTYYYQIKSISHYGESDLSSEKLHGLTYNYYQQALTTLSTLDNISPVATGTISNFDITPRKQDTNFGFRFDGRIRIPTTGNYTFYTTSDDGSNLYIDGALVVNNDYNQGMTERSGVVTGLTAGIHTIRVNFRQGTGGFGLQVRYAGPGIAKQLIPVTAMGDIEANAKTLVLPPVPLVPTNVVAISNTPNSINLTWSDNSTDETSFQILRSVTTATNFIPVKTLNANSNSYLDAGLFANLSYYYKVVAVNEGGSTTSAQAFTTTKNTKPVITHLTDKIVKTNTTVAYSVLATDADIEPLTLLTSGMPAFATFVDQTDGSGTLTVTPTIANIGIYNVAIIARDAHNGSDTTRFKISVTDKNPPQILPVQNVTVVEGTTGSAILSATSDFGVNKLVWSFTGLPSFATFAFANNIGTIKITPGYVDSGVYPVVATVTDSLNAKASTSFSIAVTDKDPNVTISVNIQNTTAATSPWNNLTSGTAVNLKDQSGASTRTGLEFQTSWWNTWYEGTTTGNNSGVYPDNVLSDYYYFGIFGGPNTVDVKVKGLDPQRQYKFSFLGSSKWSGATDNGSTVYTIGGNSVTLNVQNNTQNLAILNSIIPAADSTVIFNMSKAAGTQAGYLNALVINSQYQAGTAPAAPRALTSGLNGQNVKVSWIDAPFNEDGFDVYRSEALAGPYAKINLAAVPKNSTEYSDATIAESKKYYYKAVSFNAFGQSVYSNVDSVSIPNLAPRITVAGNLSWSANQTSSLSITAVDPPNNVVTVSVSGLPAFATYQPINSSSGNVVANPLVANLGTYSFTVSATDGYGAVSSQVVTVTVQENLLYRILVNFSQVSNAPAPWNNTAKVPAVNDVFANLKDENNVNRNVSVTLPTAFGGIYDQGAQTGSNSGIVPDAVLKEYYWFGAYTAPLTATLKISGLDVNNKYTFKFVASTTYNGLGTNGSTVFGIGGKSSAVAVQNNSTTFAKIENVITNALGEVTVDISKAAGAAAGYINGMIIEAIQIDPTILIPTNLVVAGLTKTQVGLTWNDNSSTETGFEIYRSLTGAAGSYALLTTTLPEIHSYLDNAVTSGQLYYYKVRAMLPSGPTAYTNVASGSPLKLSVFVNISGTSAYDAPVPWNNLSRVSVDGDIYFNLRDDKGSLTSMRLRWDKAMEGVNDWGMTTNNNSGIYPDKVLKSFYWTNAYNPASRLIIDGLDQAFNYNFTFLGSINTNTNVTTNFTIGNKVVANRQDLNISTTSTILDVAPDQNGEVLIVIQEAAGSPYAIFNSLVIDAYPTDRKVTSQSGRYSVSSSVSGTMKEVRFGEANPDVTLYPNPSADRTGLNVRSENSSIGDVSYQILDAMGNERGRGVYKNDMINADFNINISDLSLQSGVYILKIMYSDGQTQIRKFVKI